MPKNLATSRDSTTDYYSVLEVHPKASPEVITAAFTALLEIRSSEEVSLKEAFAVIGNQKARAAYDLQRTTVIGKVFSGYRFGELIAEGGFGKTYKGEQIIGNMPVCLKHCYRLSPKMKQVLIDEMGAVWDRRHFAIPVMRNMIELPDTSLALVMSYIPGPTLTQVIEKIGRLPPIHVAWITERILNALKYIHAYGIIHGDIKPQNIILQPDEHMAVLIDYGLSMVKPEPDAKSKGYTEYFAPPEEIAGDPLLPGSDFYSLGMTMIYALSGSLEAVSRKEVPDDVPDPMCKFIQQLIVRDVRNRPRWPKDYREEDLQDIFKRVRQESFGSASSNMKKFPSMS